jgi:hypothetical protein
VFSLPPSPLCVGSTTHCQKLQKEFPEFTSNFIEKAKNYDYSTAGPQKSLTTIRKNIQKVGMD